jgi:glutamate formiminotransferase/formiminotetrahydrofolate cyclodeaminase
MSQLVECVPNFSEGRNVETIDAICEAIKSIPNVSLLDVDMGSDFNRTVVTFVGSPHDVLQAAIASTKVAFERIDMRNHTGEHARMGAVDVVPFIPIRDTTMDECVELSNRYAEIISNEFELPIFLYAHSARNSDRKRLPDIRRGEYEGLEEKLSNPDWQPDYGNALFNPALGATATGGRSILIAYNVNLDNDDKISANRIAGKLRTSGVLRKDEDGEKIIGDDGKPERIHGRFQSLQAAGWMYNENIAQISMNLLDYSITGLHTVTDAIHTEAESMGLKVTAGELVGLVPLNALLDAGRHYIDDSTENDSRRLVNAAIDGLKLDKLHEFNANHRVIEWAAEVVR